MQAPESVRVDKWLWAVRLFRSRSLATEACHAGHVKIGGQSAKPSRGVRRGDVMTALVADVCRTIRVLALPERRVGAKLVSQFVEDLTPPEEYARARDEASKRAVRFPKGFGRPTKKQQRLIRTIFETG